MQVKVFSYNFQLNHGYISRNTQSEFRHAVFEKLKITEYFILSSAGVVLYLGCHTIASYVSLICTLTFT